MSDRVLVTYSDPEALARAVSEELGESLPWCRLDGPRSDEAAVWFCAGAPPEAPLRMQGLRWIQSGWAGVEIWFTRPEWSGNVALTRTVGDFPERITQHVFGHILAGTLNVREALRQMEERAWRRWTPASIAGQNLLVVGMGAIGREVAALGRAFRMQVKGVHKDGGDPAGSPDATHRAEEIDDLLPWADIVVNLLPLTAETRSYWSAARFDRMRRGATFVNVSRGGTVDEEALLRSLASGRIGRAILDVFREEPLPEAHPLRGKNSVWITPHVAGVSTIPAMAKDFAENWKRYRAGAPLRNLVDRARGY